MDIKKFIILLVGLVLPVGIFVFLKIFGENKFEVVPLFQTDIPKLSANCPDLQAPYQIPPSIVTLFVSDGNQLGVVVVGEIGTAPLRIIEQFGKEPILISEVENSTAMMGLQLKDCVFLLDEPYDMVLIDKDGYIRGQYSSADRDEIDRLILEVAIILEK